LDGLSQAGCHYRLNDLVREEWEGLLLLQIVRSEIEQEMMDKEKKRQQLSAATETRVRK